MSFEWNEMSKWINDLAKVKCKSDALQKRHPRLPRLTRALAENPNKCPFGGLPASFPLFGYDENERLAGLIL